MTIGEKSALEATAYHEAGHAVVAVLLGITPTIVTIVPKGSVAGETHFNDDLNIKNMRYFDQSLEKRAYVENRICITIAGTVAHDFYDKHRLHDEGDTFDELRAREMIIDGASWASNDPEKYFNRIHDKVCGLLRDNWQWVMIVASKLMEKMEIDGKEIVALRPLNLDNK